MRPSFLQRIIDLVAPRTCAICGERLMPEEDGICVACNLHMPRTDHLLAPYDNPLAQCFWGRIRHIEKSAALIYHHGGQRSSYPIYSLKYNHNRAAGTILGRLMAKEMMTTGFLDDIDCILPVPLAPVRRKERGYNQSEVIAEGMADLCHLPICTTAVVRDTFGGSQTHLDRWQRNENVANAFRLVDGSCLEGKHVLILDDVVTTGATITACASVIDHLPGIRISVAAVAFADSGY